jgi:riboflavin kinase/FMN adenylyltransferase
MKQLHYIACQAVNGKGISLKKIDQSGQQFDYVLEEDTALTIGNFDAVHLGHQAVLSALKQESKVRGLMPAVLIFEPQPLEFFKGEQAPARLYALHEKIASIRSLGIESIFVASFDQAFADLSAADFVSLMTEKLRARFLLTGADFQFGKNRQGSVSWLQNHLQDHSDIKLVAEVAPTFEHTEQRVSSTRIRNALTMADFSAAKAMQGRTYVIKGEVVKGMQLARSLGFPTANVALYRKTTPLSGVYFVESLLESGQKVTGVANVGYKPTLPNCPLTLEVHLLDFLGDLYGQELEVNFVAKCREEQKFESVDALKIQIAKDVDLAKAFFKTKD